MVNMGTDKIEVLYHDKEVELDLEYKQKIVPPTEPYTPIHRTGKSAYEFYATPSGRIVFNKFKSYKRRVFILCGIIGVEAGIITGLGFYIYNIFNGG